MKGKTIGNSLQEVFAGDFKPVDFNGVGLMDGAYADELDKATRYKPNPDEYR